MFGGDWILAGGVVRPPVPRPWSGECWFSFAGCDRTPRGSGLCPVHERRVEVLGMTVRAGTHIRSLRMPPELARAVSEASRKLRVPENRFICQAVQEVCRQAGIPIDIRPEAADLDLDLDPFA